MILLGTPNKNYLKQYVFIIRHFSISQCYGSDPAKKQPLCT